MFTHNNMQEVGAMASVSTWHQKLYVRTCSLLSIMSFMMTTPEGWLSFQLQSSWHCAVHSSLPRYSQGLLKYTEGVARSSSKHYVSVA